MQDINTYPIRCTNIVDSSQLDIDINNNSVRQYVICNLKANQAAAVLYGTPVKSPSNHQDSTPYNYYSFMAAVEKNWYLGCLKNDCTYIC
ncbi:16509_t:CDS:2 [Gigaspora margarita]|uniref:16509_t:CDS:1 n=1 Tax=Gigaspora margarita TaxID=4874 RepID=A0ABN7UX93_GIGMA|nr:16509_t:CDS:2 [Gigaspora margarita]